MKTYIDMFETMKGIFLTNKKLKSRLRTYWGTTTTVDYTTGETVEVLNKKFIIYPGTNSKRVRMIANAFGFWRSIKDEEFDGVDKYWLFFNYEKDTDSDENVEIFANKLDLKIPTGSTFVVNVGIQSDDVPWSLSKLSTETVDEYKERMKTYISENLQTGFSSELTCSCTGDTVSQTAIGFYMFKSGSEAYFTKELLDINITAVTRPNPAYSWRNSKVSKTITVANISAQIKVTKIASFDETDQFIIDMYNSDDPIKSKYVKAVYSDDDDPSYSTVMQDHGGISNYLDSIWNRDDGHTDEKWCNGYLRMSIFDSYVYDRDDFMDLIANTIDSDYKEEEQDGGFLSGTLGKIVMIVIIVVAFYFAAAAAAAAATTAGATAATAFAAAMGTASLILTIGQFVLVMGGADAAMVEKFGMLVQIVGILSVFSSIYSALSNMAKQSATASMWESVKTKAMEYMSTEASIQAKNAILKEATSAAGDVAIDAATQEAANAALKLSWSKVFSVGMKVVSKIVETMQNNKIENATNAIDDLNDQLTRANAELNDLNDKEFHIGVEQIKTSTKQLGLDNMQFQVDYQYEGTKFNILRPSFMSSGLNIRDSRSEMLKKMSLDID